MVKVNLDKDYLGKFDFIITLDSVIKKESAMDVEYT